MKIVYLVISSWTGISIEAEHFYGKLIFRDKYETIQEIELKRKLSLKEAKLLDKKDDCHTWQILRETERFNSTNDIQKLAIKTYKKLFPSAEILIEGRSSVAEPQPILAGNLKLKKEINKLNKRANEIGRWDNKKEMQKIWTKWNNLMGKLYAE